MLLPALTVAAGTVRLNVTGGEVRDVLMALAAAGGISIVADDSVTGKITLRLNDVPVLTALDLVAATKGLQYRKVGDVIIVGSAEQMGRSFSDIHIFKLQYAKAADAAAAVQLALQDHLPSGQRTAPSGDASGRLTVDTGTNTLVFFGAPQEVERIGKILAEIDVPCRQVSLEAQVVAVSSDVTRELGLEWEWSKGPNYPEYDQSETEVVYDADGKPYKLVTDPGEFIRRPEDMAGTIKFGRSPGGYPYELYYQFKLNALLTDGKANILAKPKIMTINGKEAVINIGGDMPVPVTTTLNDITTTSISYKEAGIILKYTPWINADGYITANVYTEVSSPVLVPELKAYRFAKRSANTEVRLRDGETMVIGGLIGKDEIKAMSKIPFLGDLPVLGSLFRNAKNTKSESEIIIFLTANIVN